MTASSFCSTTGWTRGCQVRNIPNFSSLLFSTPAFDGLPGSAIAVASTPNFPSRRQRVLNPGVGLDGYATLCDFHRVEDRFFCMRPENAVAYCSVVKGMGCGFIHPSS